MLTRSVCRDVNTRSRLPPRQERGQCLFVEWRCGRRGEIDARGAASPVVLRTWIRKRSSRRMGIAQREKGRHQCPIR